jgi:hypothetical protein
LFVVAVMPDWMDCRRTVPFKETVQ